MNINASIIDQRLNSIINEIQKPAKQELGITDQARLKSLAYVY
ncbi:hypothetical protein [Dactylococcopsis salina]|nr:hypothetical protein [Dactylococcopsis salina]